MAEYTASEYGEIAAEEVATTVTDATRRENVEEITGEHPGLSLTTVAEDAPRHLADFELTGEMPAVRLVPSPYLWVVVDGKWRALAEPGVRVKVGVWIRTNFWEGLWVCVGEQWRRAIPFNITRQRKPVLDSSMGVMSAVSQPESTVTAATRTNCGLAYTGEMPGIELVTEVS